MVQVQLLRSPAGDPVEPNLNSNENKQWNESQVDKLMKCLRKGLLPWDGERLLRDVGTFTQTFLKWTSFKANPGWKKAAAASSDRWCSTSINSVWVLSSFPSQLHHVTTSASTWHHFRISSRENVFFPASQKAPRHPDPLAVHSTGPSECLSLSCRF